MEHPGGPSPGGEHTGTHQHGLSKLKKLFKRRERGDGSPARAGSPTASPRQPSSPTVTAMALGSATAVPPAPSPLGLGAEAALGAGGVPLAPPTPAMQPGVVPLAPTKPELVAASPLEDSGPAPASPLRQGIVAGHLPIGSAGSPGRHTRVDLGSTRERLAHLRATAERASRSLSPTSRGSPGHEPLGPGSGTSAASEAPQGINEEYVLVSPRASQPAELLAHGAPAQHGPAPPAPAAPEVTTAAPATPAAVVQPAGGAEAEGTAVGSDRQQTQPGRHVEPSYASGDSGPATAAYPPAMSQAPEGRAPRPEAVAAAELKLAERKEEGLAVYKPASDESQRGRLSTAVAQASPYLASSPPGRRPSAAEEAAAAERQAAPAASQVGPPGGDAWQAAADQPVVAVGGTTGLTHVGGRDELAAARLRARPQVGEEAGAAGTAQAAAAGTAQAAAAYLEKEGTDSPATRQLEQAQEGEQERPLSPRDVNQGQGLAAADIAAGHKAAADAASASSGTASRPAAEGSAAGQKGPAQRPRVYVERQQDLSAPALASSSSAAGQAVEAGEQQQPAADSGPAGSGGSPAQQPPHLAAASETERPEPLLPAGAFNQEQDVSVFSPRDPASYELRDPVVLPPGPAATVKAHDVEQVRLAQLAAGASPQKLGQGPFGAQVDISVFAPEAHVVQGTPRAPLTLDRRTESEAVVVEDLVQKLQASGSLGDMEATPASGVAEKPAQTTPASQRVPRHMHAPTSGEGPEPLPSPSVPQAYSEAGNTRRRELGAAEREESHGAARGEGANRRLPMREQQEGLTQGEGYEQGAAQPPPAGANDVPEEVAAVAEKQREQRRVDERDEGPPSHDLPSEAELQEALESAVVPGQQVEAEESGGNREQAEVTGEEQQQEAAEAPVTATVTAAAQTVASKAAEAGAAAKDITAVGVEKAAQAATAGKEAAGSAAAAASEKAAGAAETVRVTMAQVVQAVTGVVSSATTSVAGKAGASGQAAKDAATANTESTTETAGAAKETAAEGTRQAGTAAEEAAEGVASTAARVVAGADETGREAVAFMQELGTGEGRAEGRNEGPEIEAEAGGEVEEHAQAPAEGAGVAAGLLGAAAHAVHAVQEQLHAVLEHGRQLAAESDSAVAQMTAGGGSTAAEAPAERDTASAETAAESDTTGAEAAIGTEAATPEGGGEGETKTTTEGGDGVEGGRQDVVLPASPAPQHTMKVGLCSRTIQKAVEQQPAVNDSQLQTLEGAEEPGTLSQAPAPGVTSSASPAAGPSTTSPAEVLPVAVSEADKQAASEAAGQSPAVDASLAAEQEVPTTAGAELAVSGGTEAKAIEGGIEGGSDGQPVVLPVSPAVPQQTMKEAVEQQLAVSDSLLQMLEGAEEPGTLPHAPAHKVAAGVHATAGPSTTTPAQVLPVAVSESDKQAASEAAGQSPAVDASLAAEQEVPEAAAAELAQPEAMDAPAEYLAERDAAREEGREAVGEHERHKEESRLRMKDVSGLEAVRSPRDTTTQPAAGSSIAEGYSRGEQGAELAAGGGPSRAELAEDLRHLMKGEPLEHMELHQPGNEAAATEAQAPALPDVPTGTKLPPSIQGSTGGLREPPPSPNVSTSPASGGVGDIPAFGPAEGRGAAGATAGASKAATRPKAPSRLITSTTVGSAVEEEGEGELPPLEDVGLQATAPRDRLMLLLQGVLGWARAKPVLAAGVAVALPIMWAMLNRIATAAFGEFGPLLLLSGAIAAAASAITWLVRWAGVPDNELQMIQEQTAEAAAGELSPGVSGGPEGAIEEGEQPLAGEEAALMDPSEPVSAASTEDLRREGPGLEPARGGGEPGILQTVRDSVAEAAEGALAVVQPGGEQAGEVVQETESGGEEVTGEDPVAGIMSGVAGAAKAVARTAGAVVDKAYQVMAREAPGADVGGQGAPLKDIVEGVRESAEVEASEGRGLAPAPPDATPHLAPRPMAMEGDNEEPGPVLQGVHPTGQHSSSTQGAGGKEAGRLTEEPTIQGETKPGVLAKAAETGGQVASSAAGVVKHAAALATGTAEEQQAPKDRLAELQQSIAQMEGERAGDVQFQKASKALGM